MKQCQYWAMNIRNNNKIKEVSNVSFKVQTEFNPKISYSYDEPEFMAQLAGHNTLIKNDKKYVFSYAYYGRDGFNATSYTGTKVKSGSASYNVSTSTAQSDALIKGTGISTLTSSEIGTQLYSWCTNGGSGSYVTSGGKTGAGAGTTVSWATEAGCGSGSQNFIKDAYYIKRTASLSSDYKSDDYAWYVDTQNGFRQLGLNAKDAANRSKSPNKDSKKWNIYGQSEEKSDMVFPISETTPRNIYQYAFTFTNVGNYNDNNNINLGRIMGTTKSVIGNNNRVCFYEVVEGVCYCCGDVLETEKIAKFS